MTASVADLEVLMKRWLVVLFSVSACQANEGPVVADDQALLAVRSCVVDTIELRDAVELGKDLAAAFDPSAVQHPRNAYPHVYLSRAFESAIMPTAEFGATVDSFHGWDIVPRGVLIELALYFQGGPAQYQCA